MRSSWQKDARERAETAQTVSDATRIARSLAEAGFTGDVKGSVERRVKVLLNIEGNADTVELVLLRMMDDYGGRFNVGSITPLPYDDNRRKLVSLLPDDTPSAWKWALWAERLRRAGDKRALAADHWLDVAKTAVAEGDAEILQEAKDELDRLKRLGPIVEQLEVVDLD